MIFNSVRVASFFTAAVVLLSGLLLACAPASSPDAPAIASVHSHRCGHCHMAPEPGSHSRASLEEALGRHHRRVHLSDGEWQAMIEYLAASDAGPRVRN